MSHVKPSWLLILSKPIKAAKLGVESRRGSVQCDHLGRGHVGIYALGSMVHSLLLAFSVVDVLLKDPG